MLAHDVHLAVPRPRLAAGAVAVVVVAAVLAPRFHAAGSPLDEGGVLAYADRILHGQLPLRDLHSFYGPLGTFLVAGVFKVFGASLGAERAVGLVYRLALAAALLGLVRRQGAWAMAAATALMLWLLPSQGVAAYATYGALSCLCAAILLADDGRPLAAGVAAGVALLFRFDFLIAVVLAAVPYLRASSARGRLRLLCGGVAGALAYVPYVALAGGGGLRVFVDGVRTSQAGRHLPLTFAPHGRGLLLDVTLLAIVVLGAAGLAKRAEDEGRVFLSVALASAGLLPYAFNRVDRQHILVAAIPSVVLLAAAVPAALGRRRAAAVAAAAVAVAVIAVGVRSPSDLLGVDVLSASLDSGHAPSVTYGGRSFRVGVGYPARAAQRAVERAAAVAPAHGGLFVGPGDLRWTSYSDAYVYYLLPQLEPATFYITLDPGSTDLPGHHLAAELAHAGVLVLNDLYDPRRGEHPKLGSAAPGRVVARDFCLRGRYPPFRVYARCRASAANTGTALRRGRSQPSA